MMTSPARRNDTASDAPSRPTDSASPSTAPSPSRSGLNSIFFMKAKRSWRWKVLGSAGIRPLVGER